MAQEKNVNDVPYIVYESTIDRLERIIKRMWILCIVMFICFVASNGVWIWYERQYEDIVTTQEVSQEATADCGDAIISDGVNIENGNR